MRNIYKNSFFIGILLTVMIPFIVKASPTAPTVQHVNTDLYYVESSSSGSNIISFLAGTTIAKSASYSAISNHAYVSLPNGNYYIWAKDATGATGEGTLVNVTDSCSNVSVVNATGTGTVSRCIVRNSDGSDTNTTQTSLVTCASGYYLLQSSYITQDDCGKKTFTGYNLTKRYCKKVYSYSCIQASANTNPKLANLSISSGSLTPEFSATNYTYTASTNESSINVSATLQDTSANFQTDFGPRTVNLNYGTNEVYIKTTTSLGSSAVYLIKINRTDSRSSDNNLSSLSVDGVSLTPNFSSNIVSYSANVSEETAEVTVNAELNNASSSFVNNFGPRKVSLNKGNNRIFIKVKSESGNVRTYTINITRAGATSNENTENTTDNTQTQNSSIALLSNLELSSGTIAFDQNTFDYNVSVANDVTNVVVTATSLNEKDKVEVVGGDNLEVGDLNEVTIKVTSEDGSVTNTYTIYVNRKEADATISSNSLLSDLKIEGYKIKFDAKDTEYAITLKEGESQLNITATPDDNNSSITIEGNENLTTNSEVKIRVTAENGTYTDYYVKISGTKKGGNVFLTIIVVLILLAVLAYLILRAMGYKIYFNLEVIKDFIKKLFHKND